MLCLIMQQETMHPLYKEFLSFLDEKNKEKCVTFAVSHLLKDDIDIVTLYQKILAPSLHEEFCGPEQIKICIWEEHVRTSIIRTIVESCFPNVIKERDTVYHSPMRGKAVVMCPPMELHEIGARMVADFFTLCGFDVTYVGANTPQSEIVNAITYFKPVFVAISITNIYNLVATSTIVENIHQLQKTSDFKLILGGQACKSNYETCRDMKADMILDTFEDIKKLCSEEPDAAV